MESLENLTAPKQDIAQTLKELGRTSDKALFKMTTTLRQDIAELCSLVANNAGRLDFDRFGDAPSYIEQVQELDLNLSMLCNRIDMDVQDINEQLSLRDMPHIKMKKYDDITETYTNFAADFVKSAAKDMIKEIQKVQDMIKAPEEKAKSHDTAEKER